MKAFLKKIFSYKIFKHRYYWWKILIILFYEVFIFCFYYFLSTEDLINQVAMKFPQICGYDVKQLLVFGLFSSMYFIAFVWIPYTIWRLIFAWILKDEKKEDTK